MLRDRNSEENLQRTVWVAGRYAFWGKFTLFGNEFCQFFQLGSGWLDVVCLEFSNSSTELLWPCVWRLLSWTGRFLLSFSCVSQREAGSLPFGFGQEEFLRIKITPMRDAFMLPLTCFTVGMVLIGVWTALGLHHTQCFEAFHHTKKN